MGRNRFSEAMIGQRFNELIVIEIIGPECKCLCDCGNITVAVTGNVRLGNTKSCGCRRKRKSSETGKKITHGMSYTRTYVSYSKMKERCLNSNHVQYHCYGGRGIKICDRWLLSFENFLEDMGERPLDRSLDRINNDGDYMKDNCRWATDVEQANNRRKRAIVLVKM